MPDTLFELIHPVPKDEPFRVEITGTNSSDELLDLIKPVGNDKPVEAPKVNPAFARGQNAPGAVRGLLSVLNGPAMGFGDEIVGGVGGIYDSLMNPETTFSEAYKANRDYARGAQEVERENNPITTALTQAAASAPLMAVKLGGLLAKSPEVVQGAAKVIFGDAGATNGVMNLTQQTARSGLSGATTGAISGAGNSEAEDLAGVLADSGKGAAIGTVLGTGAPTVLKAAATGGRAVYDPIASRVSDSYATDLARRKLAEALVRDGRRAKIVEEGLSNPVNMAAARFGKLGPDAVIADSAGASTRELLDTMATMPGTSKELVKNFLHARQAKSANRMIDAADNALDNNGQRLTATVDGLIEQRAVASKPLYDQVRQMSVEPDFELTSIVNAADKLGAAAVAKKMATAELDEFSLTLGKVADNNPLMTGQGPKGTVPQSWSLTDLDRVKRGLDSLIEGQIDQNGKLSSLGVTYLGLKKKLVTKLDDMTVDPATGESVYKAARNAFAGPSSLIDAAKIGRKSLSQKADDIARITSDFSESEREAFRVGAFEALRDKLGTSKGGRTEIQSMWENPTMREKLKAIFNDGSTSGVLNTKTNQVTLEEVQRAYREFASSVAAESRLKLLNKTGEGSQTASRMANMADQMDVKAGVEALGNAGSGNVPGAVSKTKEFFSKIATPEPVRDQIARLLLTGGKEAEQEFTRLMPITQMLNEEARKRAQRMGGMLANEQGVLSQGLPWFSGQ